MDRTVSQGLAGTTMGNESFSDLDYADDAAILAELLSVLLLSLEILSLEAPRIGLEVNWLKTKIQYFDHVPFHPPSFMIGAHTVDLVTNFTYLGVMINSKLGRSSSEIRRRIEIARSQFSQLEIPLWKTHVSLATKIRILQVLVLPVLLYGVETLVTGLEDLHRLDPFDMWCQRKLLGIGWMDRVTNIPIRRKTGLQPVSNLARERHLRLFGHIARQ